MRMVKSGLEGDGATGAPSRGDIVESWMGRSLARVVVRAAFVSCLLAAPACTSPDAPATVERQSALVSSAGLQVKVLTNSCGANQIQDFFQIVNGGTTTVKLSDISIKLWADDTSGQTLVPHVSTGGCVSGVGGNPSCLHQVAGVAAVATPFSPACGPDPTHQANWEITISDTDGGTLAPGAIWNNIQSSVNLANFSNFAPGTSNWFSSCLAGASYVSDPHFAVYYQHTLVFSSGITAPSCRAPHGQQQLTGYLTPAISAAPLVGPVPQSTVINLAVALPVQNAAGLAAKVAQVSDPTSPSYRHYLTPDLFAATYGATVDQYQNLTNWAQSNGLTVLNTFPTRLLVSVRGTVASIEKALSANLVFRRRADGSQFFGLDREPSVDLSTTLLRISGTDNLILPHPKLGRNGVANTGSGPGGNYQGNDFRHAYASCTTLTGTGQSVGLLQFDGYSQADITGYESDTGLPNVPVVPVLLDGLTACPGDASGSKCPTGTSGSLETALDIEAAIAMAPGLSQVTVYEGSLVNTILTSMATRQPLNFQLSTSWGYSPDVTTQQLVNQLAVQGQSYYDASGDDDSFGTPDAPLDPGDDRDVANVVLVGGTSLTMTGNGATYSSETTWRQGGEVGSGGGILSNVAIPFYQVGLDMTANQGSTTKLNSPDVAMVAQGCEFVASQMDGTGKIVAGTRVPGVWGTSIAAPLWAGFTALINQQSQTNGLGPLGFANPVVYAIGKSPSYGTDFSDVKTGNNGGFNAVTGYDLATGWGSEKCALIGQLSSSSPSPNLGVSVGTEHACAIRSDHSVSCWGDNDFGQMGNPAAAIAQLTPIGVVGLPLGPQVTAIAAGGSHTCALLTDQTVWCWGTNGNGQLGNPSASNPSTAVQVSSLAGAIGIASGASHSCALLQGQTVKCWGFNGDGQLGNNSTNDSPIPVDVSGLSGATSIAAGEFFNCAVVGADAHVECWGLKLDVGNGDPSDFQLTPTPVKTASGGPNLTGVAAVSAGANQICALMQDSSMQCWGDNEFGELGDGTSVFRPFPTPVHASCSSTAPLTGVSKMALGWTSSCALLAGGTVSCWGDNGAGELGDGTTTFRPCAAPVVSLTGQSAISSTNTLTCSLNQLGVSCWGGGFVGNGSAFGAHATPATVTFF